MARTAISPTGPLATFLHERGASFASGRVRGFADESEQLGAPQLAPLLGTGLLRATGADRLEFVHAHVSSEVKRLKVGDMSEGLLLNHKGHALAQLVVVRQAEAVILAVDGGAGAVVEKQLREHIIFDDVRLEPLPWATLTLQGDSAASILQGVLAEELPGDRRFLELSFEDQPLLVHPVRRSGAGGCDLHGPESVIVTLAERLLAAGARLAGERSLELQRVLAGIPSAEGEGGEGVLPQEAGLEPLVNYRKGCYLGQEIMARVEARGNLRRSLHGLKLEAWPEAGAKDIVQAGKPVGRLGTVAEHPELGVVALAVLRKGLAEDAHLEVAGTRAYVAPLPLN